MSEKMVAIFDDREWCEPKIISREKLEFYRKMYEFMKNKGHYKENKSFKIWEKIYEDYKERYYKII